MGYQAQQLNLSMPMGYQAQPSQVQSLMGWQASSMHPDWTNTAQQPNPYTQMGFQAQPPQPHIGWQAQHNNQQAPQPMFPQPPQPMFQPQQPQLLLEYQAQPTPGQATPHHVD